MKKVLYFSVAMLVFATAGCSKVPALENGSEVVAEYNGMQVTATEYYEELKRLSDVTALVNYMDQLFFDSLYEDTEEITGAADNYLKDLRMRLIY
jgi:hypothetical protein